MRDTAIHTCELETYLIAFLADIPGARASFTDAIRKTLRRATMALTRGADAWMREEVVDQAFVRLLAAPHRFDPSRGAAGGFLYQVALEAARDVRKTYPPLGGAEPVVALEDISDRELQLAEPGYASAAATEARCEVIRYAERVTPNLALAFSRLADGDALEAIAKEAGFSSRFQMNRKIKSYRKSQAFQRDARVAA